MMRRFSLAFLMVLLCATSLAAQRRQRLFTSDPEYWVSGGVAGVTGDGVNDGASASTWDFGNSWNWQYSASIEKTLSGGETSLGATGSWSRVPFAYRGTGVPQTSGATCNGCNAHLDMTTLVATYHVGSGTGFHQVIEFNGGIVHYANLKRDSDGATLAGGNNTDPFLSFGWGIGYGLDDRTQIEFVPDWGIAIHERSGLSNGVSNTNRMQSFRFAFRKGFGTRSVRR